MLCLIDINMLTRSLRFAAFFGWGKSYNENLFRYNVKDAVDEALRQGNGRSSR